MTAAPSCCRLTAPGHTERVNNSVFRIRIRIHIFLGLPDPDPSVRCMDPDPAPDPSIIKQIRKKDLDSYRFVTSFGLFIFEKNDANVPSNVISRKLFFNSFFVGVLKVNDENSRIWIRIRQHTKMSWIWNTGTITRVCLTGNQRKIKKPNQFPG
jgi:hypothetical protein